MEPLGWIVDLINEWIGGDPGTPRWATVTAIFGWVGVAGMLGWFITGIAGFPHVAGYLLGLFWIAFGIYFRRDFARLRHLAKLKRKR